MRVFRRTDAIPTKFHGTSIPQFRGLRLAVKWQNRSDLFCHFHYAAATVGEAPMPAAILLRAMHFGGQRMVRFTVTAGYPFCSEELPAWPRQGQEASLSRTCASPRSRYASAPPSTASRSCTASRRSGSSPSRA